ncbi:hypothetical protein LZ554_008269 [Drepanopeziza brunnea f. sp. 'monogermtubi']|nr:hypothetical protein LZ554_008269 [Drepanopeziza brunnea f. sp. 'monogermtubi']
MKTLYSNLNEDDIQQLYDERFLQSNKGDTTYTRLQRLVAKERASRYNRSFMRAVEKDPTGKQAVAYIKGRACFDEDSQAALFKWRTEEREEKHIARIVRINLEAISELNAKLQALRIEEERDLAEVYKFTEAATLSSAQVFASTDRDCSHSSLSQVVASGQVTEAVNEKPHQDDSNRLHNDEPTTNDATPALPSPSTNDTDSQLFREPDDEEAGGEPTEDFDDLFDGELSDEFSLESEFHTPPRNPKRSIYSTESPEGTARPSKKPRDTDPNDLADSGPEHESESKKAEAVDINAPAFTIDVVEDEISEEGFDGRQHYIKLGFEVFTAVNLDFLHTYEKFFVGYQPSKMTADGGNMFIFFPNTAGGGNCYTACLKELWRCRDEKHDLFDFHKVTGIHGTSASVGCADGDGDKSEGTDTEGTGESSGDEDGAQRALDSVDDHIDDEIDDRDYRDDAYLIKIKFNPRFSPTIETVRNYTADFEKYESDVQIRVDKTSVYLDFKNSKQAEVAYNKCNSLLDIIVEMPFEIIAEEMGSHWTGIWSVSSYQYGVLRHKEIGQAGKAKALAEAAKKLSQKPKAMERDRLLDEGVGSEADVEEGEPEPGLTSDDEDSSDSSNLAQLNFNNPLDSSDESEEE